MLFLALLLVSARAQSKDITTETYDTRNCQGAFASLPFCDTSLPISARVDDLISRLKDEEITPQLTARTGGGGGPSGPYSNITRLGLAAWDWGLNCIHGVQTSCMIDRKTGITTCPTSFPNPINYGFAWNQTFFKTLGTIIGVETRAMWLAGAVEESDWSGRPHIGLDVWSPNINLNRDPRWGRIVETTSEDPLINGLYGALHSQGLQQGVDPRYKQAIITLKHWDAYSLEDSDGFTRHNFDAIVSPFALANSYQPAFKRAVIDGEASGVMCSYNSVNGKPTCANEELVATLRGEWGFTGYLTSDSAAVEDIWTSKAKGGHEYVKTKEEGACVAIRNGTTDVCSGTTYHDALLQSVAAGLCSREDVNAALRRTFTVRMQLGLFDPAENQPYFHMGMDTVGTPATIEARRISTLEGQVLLKNAGGALPFPKGGKIAVIGPHGRATLAMAGNYLGQLCPDNKFECIQSPFDAITAANAGGSVTFTLGCNITGTDASGIPAAVDAASAADRVVLFLGIDGTIEGESNDRDSIDLPSIQHQLAAAVAGAGKPTAIVLFHAGSLDISAELGNAAIAAIVEAGYPGVVGGAGVAATLLGDNDRLGGKLSYTVYPASYVNQIKMSEMELDVGVGRGYRYYTGTPVLPFGFGLAFTTFSFSTLAAVSAGTQTGLRLRTEPDGWGVRRVGDGGGNGPAFGESIMMSVNVTNTGAVTGDTVVQAFLTPTAVPAYTLPAGRLPLIKQLFGYQRVHLAPGETVTVNIPVTAATFRLDDRITGKTLSLPGGYTVTFTDGSGSGDQAVSVELY